MNGYEYDFARARVNDFVAEAERHRLVSTAVRERREARAMARAQRRSSGVSPFRRVLVLASAALHSVS